MMDRETSLRLYQELADRFDKLHNAGKRDLFLVLAAEAALSLGLAEVAERLLHKLLAVSPHNLLKPYSSLAEALRSPDVQFYVEDLKRQFPPEKAEQVLQELEDRAAVAMGDVYAVRDEAPRRLDAPRPEVPRPMSMNPSPALPKIVPARPPVSPYSYARPPESAPADNEDSAGSWFAWLLFFMMVGAAIALAWYAFVGPML